MRAETDPADLHLATDICNRLLAHAALNKVLRSDTHKSRNVSELPISVPAQTSCGKCWDR